MKHITRALCAVLLCAALASAAAAAGAEEAPVQFADLTQNAWYYGYVQKLARGGVVEGDASGSFRPDAPVTRAELVTMLWRMTEQVEMLDADSFASFYFAGLDETVPAFGASSMVWACHQEILLGYGDGRLGMNDAATREQAAAILWRFAKKGGLDVSVGENTNILSYEDVFSLSEYAFAPVQWACGAGFFNCPDGMLRPQDVLTRAEAAKLVSRMYDLLFSVAV